jgi:transcriptional regulator with XRE-family HTH domain
MTSIINTTQINFIKKIKDQLPPQFLLVNELADLLGLSNDSAYRRIRGETDLSIDELKKICAHFKVSLDDELDSASEAVTFSYKAIDHNDITLEKYLTAIHTDISKIEKFEQKDIIYAAKDIPLFHHFQFPELAAFKIFFWMKSILNCPSHEGQVFDTSCIESKDVEMGKEILDIYIKVPATEIWTEETLNSTLKQLEYYWESGFIPNKEDALLLCDQITEMMQHIQKQAEKGIKYASDKEPVNNEGNFKLYFSEVMIGNNNILVNIGNVQVTYLTHNTLNYLITTNPSFCSETDYWLKNLMKKSILLSGASEKQRNQFFRKAFENIKMLKASIN